jgi:hypothetical protein
MISIPKIVFQTQLNEWSTIEQQIERSKIKRYPYKSLLGLSLTKYLFECLNLGLSSQQSFIKILELESIKNYLKENPLEVNNFTKNLWICCCARYSESKIYMGKELKPYLLPPRNTHQKL